MATILLVEDNSHIMKINAKALAMREYEVLCAETLEEAKRKLQSNPVDLIVLDIVLPDGSGLDFCKQLKTEV